MKITHLLTSFITILILMLAGKSSFAGDEVYGWSLMTKQERMQHRETMRNFKTNEEREQYRLEHHKRMQERAKEKGVRLPDRPREQYHKRFKDDSGMGTGMGAGKGR